VVITPYAIAIAPAMIGSHSESSLIVVLYDVEIGRLPTRFPPRDSRLARPQDGAEHAQIDPGAQVC
jgi:hypothetical protein